MKNYSEGNRMYKLAAELFPICRSITGEGIRTTLRRIQKEIPQMTIYEVPSGTKSFDWTIPNEWEIEDAYIEDSNGDVIIDFKQNNLHVVGYSIPIDERMPLEELDKHLYSLPDHPEWIPYVTSYYKERRHIGGTIMRKLGNTLYVTLPDVYLSLDGENIVVLQDGKEVRRIPLHNLESILVFGYTGASPALMGACARRGIALSFFTPSGRFLSRVTGEGHGNVVLRKTQYRISDDEQQSLGIARSFLFGKLHNSRWVLERAMRDHPMRLDATKVDRASGFLKNALGQLSQAQNLEQLRGVEGEAASRYFSVFDELILQQKDSFSFSSRSRRPPLDRVNALLSFTYSLLAHDVSSALESVGLDPYVGFLHRDRPGRTSLSLDLMEEFRSVIADRFVLSIINKKQVKATGFTEKENGAILMDDDTRRSVLNAWQLRKQEMLTHPFLEEKISWGLVPYIQAMLLARYLRGDLDGYPPFFWK